MDELIKKYAEILRSAKVGDYTYEGILASFAREMNSSNDADSELFKPFGPGSNTGHGHVWPRPDGNKARCGGISMCRECAADWKKFGGGLRDSS